MKVDINERAFRDAIEYALTEATLVAVDEVVKVTPRDIERLPKNTLDRKDGKTPIRRGGRKPVQIFGHWYQGVTGNLKESIAMEVDRKKYIGMVGISSSGPAVNYAAAQEFGNPKNGTPERSYLRKTVADPEVQRKLHAAFERAFFERLQRYNR